jgi:hypothetical protein
MKDKGPEKIEKTYHKPGEKASPTVSAQRITRLKARLFLFTIV